MEMQDIGDQACVDVKSDLNIQHKEFVPPTARNGHVEALTSVCADCSGLWVGSRTAIRDVHLLI